MTAHTISGGKKLSSMRRTKSMNDVRGTCSYKLVQKIWRYFLLFGAIMIAFALLFPPPGTLQQEAMEIITHAETVRVVSSDVRSSKDVRPFKESSPSNVEPRRKKKQGGVSASSLDIMRKEGTQQHLDLQDLIKSYQRSQLSNRVDRCSERPSKRKCECPDPLVPGIRKNNSRWMKHSNKLLNEAKNFVQDVDIVFLGDSLTERWRGTQQLEKRKDLRFKEVFETYFGGVTTKDVDGNSQRGVSAIKGLAFGAGGDTTTELLWKLDHGLLPPHLNPKLFYVLIGTNDLGNMGCSKQTTLIGILNILDTLDKLKPRVPILIHGLLPRLGPRSKSNMTELDGYWDQIVWINQQLKKLAEHHQHHFYYMESQSLFLSSNSTSHLNTDLLPDGLHPDIHGYKLWGPRIADKVARTLADQKTTQQQQQDSLSM